MAEQPRAETDQHDAGAEHRHRLRLCRNDHHHEGGQPDQRAGARHAEGVGALAQHLRRQSKTDEAATGKCRGQLGRRPDAQPQYLPAIGFKQHILHGEGERAQPHRHQPAHRLGLNDEGVPALLEARLCRRRPGAQVCRLAGFLLPGGDEIEKQGNQRRCLDDLNQPPGGEIDQKSPEQQRTDDRAEQQHDIHQSDDIGLVLFGREVGRQRKADRLGDMDARADQQDRQSRAQPPDPFRRHVGLHRLGQHEQGERHHCQPAELQNRAAKNIGHPPPAQRRLMRI